MNWLFVCTGNTCRSPMAAACLKKYLADSGSADRVMSAGLAADGSPATENAVAVMAEWGMDVSSHRSAPLTVEMCDWADRILVMTPMHKFALINAGVAADKVSVLAEKEGGIVDPYGGDLDTYRFTRDQLQCEIQKMLKSDWQCVSMTEDHVVQVAALEQQIFSGAWSHHAIAEELQNSTAGCRVLTQNDGTVGAYIIWHHVLDELFIERIATSPAYLRQGLSSKLLKTAQEYAEQNGVSRITLEVRVSNKPAIALYEKHGFQNEGVRPGFYDDPKEDAYIYSRYI